MIVQANALHIPLAPGSVHMCACSPPYWGLRDYGTAGQLGAEPLHDCLAWARGAEPCGGCFVCAIRAVGREVWRVLRDDGTWWLNLGDSYGGGSGGSATNSAKQKSNRGTQIEPRRGDFAKQLMMIPARVALALQADGWYLRSDIIWHKPAPMPESVTDRPTNAHEHVFLLAKNARYYYDAEAVKEASEAAGRIPGGNKKVDASRGDAGRDMTIPVAPTRNRRNVWTVNTQPYAGAHYAVWPPALVEPMILAGSKPGDIVLDPFAGSGTTGAVARLHGRRFVGLDISLVYLRDHALARAEKKTSSNALRTLPLFAE